MKKVKIGDTIEFDKTDVNQKIISFKGKVKDIHSIFGAEDVIIEKGATALTELRTRISDKRWG